MPQSIQLSISLLINDCLGQQAPAPGREINRLSPGRIYSKGTPLNYGPAAATQLV